MVHVLLAEGFEEIEALAAVDILRRADIDVKLIAVSDSIHVCGAHKICVECDELIENADESCEMVVLPGGYPGYVNLENNPALQSHIARAAADGKYIAAICASPSIIGKQGYLKGKTACCYPSFEDKLIGANVVFDDVVCDGKFITSRGAGTAHKFASKIIEVLKDKDTAKEVLKSMIYADYE